MLCNTRSGLIAPDQTIPFTLLTTAEKVLKRLDFEVKKADVEAIVNCKPGVIELVMMQLQQKVRALLRVSLSCWHGLRISSLAAHILDLLPCASSCELAVLCSAIADH